MGGREPVELMGYFREPHCCIQMRKLIDVKRKSKFTMMVTNFINQPVSPQKHMRVPDLGKHGSSCSTFGIRGYLHNEKPVTSQRLLYPTR